MNIDMITPQVLRDTILGKLVWRKCPQCEGTGWENWNIDGDDVKGGRTGDPERTNGKCENCDSIGFVEAYKND